MAANFAGQEGREREMGHLGSEKTDTAIFLCRLSKVRAFLHLRMRTDTFCSGFNFTFKCQSIERRSAWEHRDPSPFKYIIIWYTDESSI